MPSETPIVFPPFRLDVLHGQLWRDNELVPVRPKPFAVLGYLATHPGRLVTAAELRKVVWPNTYVSEGLLWSYMAIFASPPAYAQLRILQRVFRLAGAGCEHRERTRTVGPRPVREKSE